MGRMVQTSDGNREISGTDFSTNLPIVGIEGGE